MKRVVGIFSREAPSCYRFLSDFLKAEDCITEVRSFTVTNNGFQRLQEEASCCHFAILYHSKNRGRINITDVTDSLYDEELRCLSQKLGRKNVLVVAADLDISSPEVKKKILRNQPLIEEMAADFYLFSNTDKNSRNLLNEKLQKISSHIPRKDSHGNELRRSVLEAVEFIYKLTIRCIMVVVGFVQFSCSMPIQGVMIVVGFVQFSYSLLIQGVMIVVGFVQFSCRMPIQGVMKARDLCSSFMMRQSTMSR